MSFRFSFEPISTPWLAARIGLRIFYTIGTMLDAYSDEMREGIKARMPGIGTYTALPYLGRDRQIDRGPTEPDASYAARLSGAFDAWRIAGSARAILEQLRAYFSPSDGPPMRTVSNQAVWHEIDPTSGETTKTVVRTNWQWDSFGQATPRTKNHRGWVIIEGLGIWILDRYDGTTTWGDGGTWGSTALPPEVAAIRGIVRKWKSAHNYVPSVIVTFNAGLFLRSNLAAANPNAPDDWNSPFPRLLLEANFWEPVRT